MLFSGRNRIIMDSIHGLTEFDSKVRRIVDTREVQRLRWIHQTGLGFLVYPGAEHSRFAHAIGAYGVATRVFQHLRSLGEISGLFGPSDLDDDLRQAFVIAALCHDLGHTAFSHVLEQVLLPNGLRSHEACTWEILEGETEVAKQIRDSCDLEQVIQLLRRVHWNKGLCNLLSGDVDVDRWDYLLRDAAAAGVVYGTYDLDWLIHSLSLEADSVEGRPNLVIEARRGLVALKHFLTARRSMYQQVYWHTTVRSAERMLRAIFERLLDPARPKRKKFEQGLRILPGFKSLVAGGKPTLEEFLQTDDIAVLTAVKQWAFSSPDPVLRFLCRCFSQRRLFKQIRIPDAAVATQLPKIQEEVKAAFKRQAPSAAPELAKTDMDIAIGYLVLVDTCKFEAQTGLQDIYFDVGEETAKTLDLLRGNPEFDIAAGLNPFSRTRAYVPGDVLEAVENAVGVRA